ncbi:DUF4252 domain-containing protein [Flavobacterium sp. MK4S-17]|jgi:hypothetical protein|uniref:DUF4252 domain-containing protein n=1 Tax=Flavobacterium sp. MK4S-17 TaxID=2543737 RepID=UPI0013575371|nr:DUF4252 domain-containing protein [Flavobacterium sp. MK4S-17]
MKKVLYPVVVMAFWVLVSCSGEPTLQKYFVDHADQKNYATVDIAPTFINTDSLELSKQEQDALKSLKKLNVLLYKADSLSTQEYDKEQQAVKSILKQDSYEELIKFNNGDMGASINTKGEGEHIEEFVIFVHEKPGFGVVRVLGDNMTPNNVLTIAGLLQKGNLDMDQLKPLQQLMNSKK